MNRPDIYYKEQCDYCINKGICNYERRTRTFVETISGVESLTRGVFGSLSFKCDYFNLDHVSYDKANPPTCNG